nr:hypothetical protein [Jiangella alba]
MERFTTAERQCRGLVRVLGVRGVVDQHLDRPEPLLDRADDGGGRVGAGDENDLSAQSGIDHAVKLFRTTAALQMV